MDEHGNPLTTDQRGPGFPRIVGVSVDIGAFEGIPGGTSTALTSSVNPSTYGQSVTFTATVTGSGTPTGTVTFYAGAVNPADQIGTGTLSVVDGQDEATFSTAALTAGSHTIT